MRPRKHNSEQISERECPQTNRELAFEDKKLMREPRDVSQHTVIRFENPNQDEGITPTNTAIIEITKNELKRTIYVPVYIQLKVKNFMDLKVQQLGATILTVIRISFGVRNLREYIIVNYDKQVYDFIYNELTHSIRVHFSRNEMVILDKSNQNERLKFQENDTELTFTLWMETQFNVYTSWYFFEPFGLLNLRLTIRLEGINELYFGKEYEIKFNCMETSKTFDNIPYNPLAAKYGQFSIAKSKINFESSSNPINQQDHQTSKEENLFQAKYFQEKKNKYQKQRQKHNISLEKKEQLDTLINNFTDYVQEVKRQEEIKNRGDNQQFVQFKYAHITIPMYRNPIVDLLTIFIPLWIQNVINLMIFYQNPGLSDGLANVATVMVAVAALTLPIRQANPPSAQFTIIDLMIFLSILTTVFTLIHIFQIRNQNPSQYQFSALISSTAWLFWIAVVMDVINFLVIIGLFIYFGAFLKRSYDRVLYLQRQHVFWDIDKTRWLQKQCDEQFLRHRQWLLRQDQKNQISFVHKPDSQDQQVQ